jgi:hypothetical protein
MKKLVLEYTLIPIAVKSYMFVGATLYKAKMFKAKMTALFTTEPHAQLPKLAQA